jgi:hypothetical protein
VGNRSIRCLGCSDGTPCRGSPERRAADGCTLLDDIWVAEPFRGHGAFVRHVAEVTRAYDLRKRDRKAIRRAAERSGVGGPDDRQIVNPVPYNRLVRAGHAG